MNMHLFSFSLIFVLLLCKHNAIAFGATPCVPIVQQRMQHFYAKPRHSVKLAIEKRVKNIIVLYNSECNTFIKIHSLLMQFVKAKISSFFIFNTVGCKNIFLNRTCIMLINDFERQKYTYLRHLLFMKKVICTYRLQLLQRVAI